MLTWSGHRVALWIVVAAFAVQGATNCLAVPQEPDNAVEAIGVDPELAAPAGEVVFEEVTKEAKAGPPVPCDLITLVSATADMSKVIELSKRCKELSDIDLDEASSSFALFALIHELDEAFQEMNITETSGMKCTTKILLTIPRNGSAEFGYLGLMGVTGKGGIVEEILKKEAPEMLTKLQGDEDGFVEDEDGTFLYRSGSLVILESDSEYQPDPAQLMQAFETTLRELTEAEQSTVCEVKFAPSEIHNRQKDSFIQQVLAAVYTDIQRRDNESDLEYRMREGYGRSVTGLIDTLFNQLDYVQFSMRTSEYSGNLCWDLDVRAIPDSDLDQWIKRQAKCESRTVRTLHPDRVGFVSVSLAIPESLQASLPLLGLAISSTIQEEGLLSEAGTKELAAAFSAMAEQGVFDFMIQVVPDAERRPNLFAVLPLHESAALSTTAIELVSRIEDGDVDPHHSEVEGWTVQRLGDMHAVLKDSGLTTDATSPTDCLLVVTDREAIIQLASPDSGHLLRDVVLGSGQDDESNARFRKSGLSLQFKLSHLLQTLYGQESEEAMAELYPASRRESGALEDGISISMFEEDHQFLIRTEFERDNTVVGAVYFVSVIGILGEFAAF